MFKIIIFYELVFVIFWNVLYFANGDFNSWVGNQFLTAAYTFLATMALGLTIVYVMYITAKLSGFLDKIKKLTPIQNRRQSYHRFKKYNYK